MASPRVLPQSTIQKLATFKDKPSSIVSSPSFAADRSSPLDSFAADPIFSAFLSPDFDSSRFCSQALTSNSAIARAEYLQHGIRQLEQQLRSEVQSRHEDLLSQLSSLRDAESALSTVRSGVSSLQSLLRHARSEISDPRRLLSSHTLQLSNLHRTAELLQSAFKLLRQSRRLRDLTAERPDLAKAAEMHHEIEIIYEECDLRGISAVDEEMKWVSEMGIRLRSEAMAAIEKGMDESNPNEIWCGLQVFFNLGELRSTVEGLVNKYKALGVKNVGISLDMKAISGFSVGSSGPGGAQRSGTPQIGGGKKAAEALWERVGKCMEELHGVITAVWQLQTVLARKRVPFTNVFFLNEVWEEGSPLLTERVWEAVAKSFSSQMNSIFTASSFIKETLTNGYPKLFSMVENLLERIIRDTKVKGVPPALGSDGPDQLVNAIDSFQKAFLGSCLSRLNSQVNTLLPMSGRSAIPSKDQISRFLALVHDEIEAVRFHGPLTLLVLREVNKALLLLGQRAEYQMPSGAEARQVSGPATPAQLKTFALCHLLEEVHISISAAIAELASAPAAAAAVSAGLGIIQAVAVESAAPLFQAMQGQLDSLVLKIHDEDYNGVDFDGSGASRYVAELEHAVSHYQAEFLPGLGPARARALAARVAALLVREAALVRPLSEAGKLRLARDVAEVEALLGRHVFPGAQPGAPQKSLVALQRLIFLDSAALVAAAAAGGLPLSAVVHHLFSRAAPGLMTPAEREGLTAAQYSLWMDAHGEEHVARGVRAAVESYYLSGGAKDEVCELMLSICDQILSHQGTSSVIST
ncbi:Golgi transport complex protein-like protein [Wolffia australiana]